MNKREHADFLRRTMWALSDTVANPADIHITLSTVTTAAVALIAGVDFADVLMMAGPDNFSSLAATAQLPIDIDRLQQQFGEGPCVTAAAGESVLCNDLRNAAQWPRFAKSAVTAGVRSVLSFQLYTHGAQSAALNLFGVQPDVFDPDAEALGAMLATHAANALIAHDKELQFKSALASRDIIGQAKGMIMERFDVDAVRAFELLTKLSQSSNIRVADVAAEIVARGSDSRPKCIDDFAGARRSTVRRSFR
jgi:ANTAR domain/GAF domain